MSVPLPKLYHLIADLDSARVRRFIQENDLSDKIQFANIGVGERDLMELKSAISEAKVPVLKTPGGKWLQGADPIIEFLRTIAD
jgi:hypothetical protein